MRLGLVITFNMTSYTLGSYASIDPGSAYKMAVYNSLKPAVYQDLVYFHFYKDNYNA